MLALFWIAGSWSALFFIRINYLFWIDDFAHFYFFCYSLAVRFVLIAPCGWSKHTARALTDQASFQFIVYSVHCTHNGGAVQPIRKHARFFFRVISILSSRARKTPYTQPAEKQTSQVFFNYNTDTHNPQALIRVYKENEPTISKPKLHRLRKCWCIVVCVFIPL